MIDYMCELSDNKRRDRATVQVIAKAARQQRLIYDNCLGMTCHQCRTEHHGGQLQAGRVPDFQLLNWLIWGDAEITRKDTSQYMTDTNYHVQWLA